MNSKKMNRPCSTECNSRSRHLRKLQQLPERVKRYFKHSSIDYAAK